VTCSSSTRDTPVETRTANCVNIVTGEVVSDREAYTLCGASRPELQQACASLEPCVNYYYNVGPWGDCSARCGAPYAPPRPFPLPPARGAQ
jgi:hypothetical protein